MEIFLEELNLGPTASDEYGKRGAALLMSRP